MNLSPVTTWRHDAKKTPSAPRKTINNEPTRVDTLNCRKKLEFDNSCGNTRSPLGATTKGNRNP